MGTDRRGNTETGLACGGGGEDWTRWGAVGKSGFLAWRCAIGGASTEEIARARGVEVKWARRLMLRLEAVGAVQAEADGRWRAVSATKLAQVYGTEGLRKAAEQNLQNQRRRRRDRKNR